MLTVTDAAALKAAELLARDGTEDMFLRVSVQPGGCAGLRYSLFFDDRRLDGDESLLVEAGPLPVRIDRHSAPYLEQATVDFIDTLEKQGFVIDNPAAQSSCACGDSFA